MQSKAPSRILFDQICKQLHLLEVDYFGLEYNDLSNVTVGEGRGGEADVIKDSGGHAAYLVQRKMNNDDELMMIEMLLRLARLNGALNASGRWAGGCGRALTGASIS